jgi:hypothetical protein
MFLLAMGLLFLVACFAVLFWRLASRFDAQHCTAVWLDNFSLESYAPMERLLDKGDLAFLKSQPGYRPQIGKRMMAERRKIFRSYLRLLVRDFNQLIAIGKLMVVFSTRDQQEFARSLWRQQVRFYAQFCMLYVQLSLYPLGWPAVDARNLVASLGAMRNKVGQLASPGLAFGRAI